MLSFLHSQNKPQALRASVFEKLNKNKIQKTFDFNEKTIEDLNHFIETTLREIHIEEIKENHYIIELKGVSKEDFQSLLNSN